MAIFTIRVELHNAQLSHYLALAKSLQASGIVDVVKDDTSGVLYKMSPGEYSYVGNATLDTVFNACTAAANATGLKNAVFVSECSARKWIGLPVVK